MNENTSKKMIQITYQKPWEPQINACSDADLSDGMTYNEATAEVPAAYAKEINEQVFSAIEDAEDEYHRSVETLVLGREEYLALDVLYRSADNNSGGISPALAPIDVVTVPGRMIHVPKPTERVVWDKLTDTSD